MSNLKIVKLCFIIEASTNISHGGGEMHGNVALMRRTKIVGQNGSVVDIPCVSGNGVRGSMRDFCAGHFLNALDGILGGSLKMSIDAFHLIFSGGALREANLAGDVDFAKMVKKIPLISLFGGAYGNVIYPSKLQVGYMIPIVEQTLHIIPPFAKEAYGDGEIPDACDIMSLNMFTRKDDTGDEKKTKFLEEGARNEESSQMIYHVDCICAGTKFYWWLNAVDVTDDELNLLLFAIENMPEVPVGGKRAVGFGKVSINKYAAKQVSLFGEQGVDLRYNSDAMMNFLQANADELKTILSKI